MAGKRDLAAVLGQAVGAGLAQYNVASAMSTSPCSIPSLMARTTAERLLGELEANGQHVGEWDQSQKAAVPDRAAKAVERYMAADPIPPEWPILMVEQRLASGVAQPDLVVDDGRGPTPVDYKTKLTLKKEYEDREIARWRYSWQMLHYCWELKADHYYICLIVLEPRFRAELIPFEIHPSLMQVWSAGAAQTWADMKEEDEGRRVPAMAAKHADEYGECEYAKACFTHHLDPERMAQDYIRLERR